jgi:hypothetical protein
MTGCQKALQALGILYNTDHDNLTSFYLNVGKCSSCFRSSVVKRILKHEHNAFYAIFLPLGVIVRIFIARVMVGRVHRNESMYSRQLYPSQTTR